MSHAGVSFFTHFLTLWDLKHASTDSVAITSNSCLKMFHLGYMPNLERMKPSLIETVAEDMPCQASPAPDLQGYFGDTLQPCDDIGCMHTGRYLQVSWINRKTGNSETLQKVLDWIVVQEVKV